MRGGRRRSRACDRNWAELQRDVLMVIFVKMGVMDLLRGAGCVCRSWRKFAKEEPDLWRSIDMTNHGYGSNAFVLTDPTRLAIDRSGDDWRSFRWSTLGMMIFSSISVIGHISISNWGNLITSVLKKLCLISCYQVSEEAIAETAKRQPLLEEIQITFGSFEEKVAEIVGKECPQLESFKFNNSWFNMPPLLPDDHEEVLDDDDEALGIAKTMHQLRHLQLIGNRLTNEGLKAILDGCPYLETLDICRCYNVNMDADMRGRCARLKTIRLPGDSVDDYKFEAEVDGSGLALFYN